MQSAPKPASSIKRLYVECTHTATTGINTGIQRVVRKIIEQWGDTMPDGTPVQLVMFDGGHFYKINTLPDNRYKKVAQTNKKELSASLKEKILVNLQSARIRFASWMPSPKLKAFILASRQQKSLAWLVHLVCIRPLKFIKHKLWPATQPEYVLFEPDDVLLMLDSSWHYPIQQISADARAADAKIITVVYDLIPIKFPELCEAPLTKAFTDWVNEASKFSDAFIAISQTVRDDLHSHYHQLGSMLTDDHYGYFYLGAEVSAPKGAVRSQLKSSIDKNNTYLIVCTIEPRKNHRLLFEAFKALWQQGRDVKLHIVGRIGWKVDELIAEIKAHPQFGERLFLWHDLNDTELVYCYENAKALIFPSIVEGFGLPIIEAQHHQLPVLVSDTPIHREVGGDSVKYFSLDGPEDLVALITSIETRQTALPSANPADIARYTWQNSAQQLWLEIQRISKNIDN